MITDSYSHHFKQNFKIATPIIMSQLGHMLVGVVDSIMVGRVGEVPLAASALGNSVFFLFLCFGIGISFGITPLVAKAKGEKNVLDCNFLLKNALFLNFIVSVFIFILVYVCTFYLDVLQQPQEVVSVASPYLLIISYSIVPFMIFQTFKQFAEGLSFTKNAMIITLFTNVLNVFFNYIFIYGNWGFDAMGLNGAGLGTLLARIIMAILMVLYIFKNKKINPFSNLFKEVAIKKYYLISLWKIGFPSGLQFSFEVSAFIFAAIMMGWLGATQLAAHQIAMSMASISYMIANGFASAGTVRIGNELGKKNFKNLFIAAKSIFFTILITELIFTILFIVGRNQFPLLFIKENDVLIVAANLMVMAALFQISDGLQVGALSALRGISDTKIPTYITLFAYWIVGLPLGYLFGFVLNYNSEGIWMGLVISLTISAALLLTRFFYLTNRLIKNFS